MKSKFEIYCAMFKTNPKSMRKLLSNYFYYPSDIRELLLDEYHARRDGRPFKGREPRPEVDISIEFKLPMSDFEKLLEIHESGLFELIKKSNQEEKYER